MKINGVNVKDAKSRVVLHITKRDVDRGNTKDPAACAAALACKRELGATEARVHIGRTYLKIGDNWVRFGTSKALRTEIIAFDRGGTFEPGEYTLSPMKPSERLLAEGGRRKKKGPKIAKIAKKKHYHVTTGIRAHGANR